MFSAADMPRPIKAKKYFKEDVNGVSGVVGWWNPEVSDRAYLYEYEVRLIAKYIQKLVEEPSKAKFLELAAGGGRVRSWLGPKHLAVLENTTNYKCLDINRGMLDIAQERLSKEGIRVGFIEASAEDIPLLDSSVDVIICVEAFVHFDDLDKVLSETNRVLKQGGILISSIDYSNSLRRIVKRAVDFINYRLNNKYEYRGKGIFRPYTDREYHHFLTKNGFEFKFSERYGVFAPIDVALLDEKRRVYILPALVARLLFPLDRLLSKMPLTKRLATYYLTAARKVQKL